jgi:hypothetical protein
LPDAGSQNGDAYLESLNGDGASWMYMPELMWITTNAPTVSGRSNNPETLAMQVVMTADSQHLHCLLYTGCL